jgi:hypothetical protein
MSTAPPPNLYYIAPQAPKGKGGGGAKTISQGKRPQLLQCLVGRGTGVVLQGVGEQRVGHRAHARGLLIVFPPLPPWLWGGGHNYK